MKIAELKELTKQELQDKLAAEKDNLVRIKLSHAVSALENPSQIKDLRRSIARMKSELRSRELNQK